MFTKKALSFVALASFAVVTLAGCSAATTDSAATPAAAADPTSLTLALVPSQDQAGLVDTAAPLTDMLTAALGIPVTGVVSKLWPQLYGALFSVL